MIASALELLVPRLRGVSHDVAFFLVGIRSVRRVGGQHHLGRL